MSRFRRFGFGGLLIATVLIPLVGTAVFPGPVGASQPSRVHRLHVIADTPGGSHLAGLITSDAKGSDVDGHFALKTTKGELVSVEATCLEVSAIAGGKAAGVGGRVDASSDASLPVGTAILVQAFESHTSRRDTLDFFHLPGVPGHNQCNPPRDPGTPIKSGKISIVL
jgi:hypothetical protein